MPYWQGVKMKIKRLVFKEIVKYRSGGIKVHRCIVGFYIFQIEENVKQKDYKCTLMYKSNSHKMLLSSMYYPPNNMEEAINLCEVIRKSLIKDMTGTEEVIEYEEEPEFDLEEYYTRGDRFLANLKKTEVI